MLRKVFPLVSVFMALSIVLAACAPAATPPPPPAAEQPAEMPEPTEMPAPTMEPEPPKTIVDVAKEAGSFQTLLTAATEAGLAETLISEGPFTIFAPTDEAFAKLPEGTVEALLQDKEALKQILLYHVVEGSVMAADVTKLTNAMTLAEIPVQIKVEGESVMINESKVTAVDITASNGVIHVIDSVLLPPKNIVETASGTGTFQTLLAAATAAGLAETLTNDGPFTVFAPSDEAFAKLPAGTVEALLKDPEALKKILLYHVVEGFVFSGDVVGLKSAETLNGKDLTIEVTDGKVMIDASQVVAADILASNGVIHVVDSVLLPKPNIVEAASADGRFKTLLAAAEAAGLVETLESKGPFTVFAPTDDAFAKLPAGTVEALLKDIPTLKSILLYHVVPGAVKAEDVVKLTSADTAAEKPVSIKVDGGSVFINESKVVITDIMTSNGVIHVIDAVLLPPQ